MTEYSCFIPFNMQNKCRTCLATLEDLFPMTPQEIDMYYKFVDLTINTDYEYFVCLHCKWMFRKLIKFSEQCRRADEIFRNVKFEPNTYVCPKILISSHDFKVQMLEPHYLGPEDDVIDDGSDTHAMDDHHGDDDDVPLVMLRDDGKKRKKTKNGLKTDSQIKQETFIKQETPQPQETCKKKIKCKKKELREGFTSRMVQETNEYVVIKLSQEQVLQEMQEKSKNEAYIRAPFKCKMCVKGFNFEDVLRSHMEKHTMEHGAYKCEMCSQYCPNPVSLRGHIKSHTTRYKCKLCGQVRLSRQHLLEHHAITHTNAATAYTCEKCNFTTNKRTVIQRHVKSHVASEQHACHRCGKLFKTIESLRVHAMRHDKTSRVRCTRCDKQFIYPSLLNKHIAAVHERDDYYCVECDVKFKSPESLKLHFKKAKRHRDASSYKHQCPQCPQRFVSASALAVHASAAHGAAKQFRCGQCRRRYGSRDAARAHRWRAHAQADRAAHACELCEHTFTRKSTLKAHLRTHTGEKPHACECGAAFAQRSTLTAHQAAKHQKQNTLNPNGIETIHNDQET